jgi:hypothetical protein
MCRLMPTRQHQATKWSSESKGRGARRARMATSWMTSSMSAACKPRARSTPANWVRADGHAAANSTAPRSVFAPVVLAVVSSSRSGSPPQGQFAA